MSDKTLKATFSKGGSGPYGQLMARYTGLSRLNAAMLVRAAYVAMYYQSIHLSQIRNLHLSP